MTGKIIFCLSVTSHEGPLWQGSLIPDDISNTCRLPITTKNSAHVNNISEGIVKKSLLLGGWYFLIWCCSFNYLFLTNVEAWLLISTLTSLSSRWELFIAATNCTSAVLRSEHKLIVKLFSLLTAHQTYLFILVYRIWYCIETIISSSVMIFILLLTCLLRVYWYF